MNHTKRERTMQWILFMFLFLFGPIGWIAIYFLWKRWNPQTNIKSVKGASKKKTTKNKN